MNGASAKLDALHVEIENVGSQDAMLTKPQKAQARTLGLFLFRSNCVSRHFNLLKRCSANFYS